MVLESNSSNKAETRVSPSGSIAAAVWPEDGLCGEESSSFLSIVCSESHFHWAWIPSKTGRFSPELIWRTPIPTKDERQHSSSEILARFLPGPVYTFVFGDEDAPATRRSAWKAATQRPFHQRILRVYAAIQDDNLHTPSLAFLFDDIPSRVVRISPSDLLPANNNPNNTLPLDRLLTFQGALALYGAHGPSLLVLEATGLVLQYTILDTTTSHWSFRSGCAPGLQLRCQTWHDARLLSRPIQPTDILTFLQNSKTTTTTQPPPLYMTSTWTTEACIRHVLTELSYLLQHLVLQTTALTEKPCVCCVTDSDAIVVARLLTTRMGSLCPSSHVHVHANLFHHGMIHAIQTNQQQSNNKSAAIVLGQGVAIVQHTNSPQLGLIVGYTHTSSKPEPPQFHVLWEHQGRGTLSVVQLYDAMQLFQHQHSGSWSKFTESDPVKQACDWLLERYPQHLKKAENQSSFQSSRSSSTTSASEAVEPPPPIRNPPADVTFDYSPSQLL